MSIMNTFRGKQNKRGVPDNKIRNYKQNYRDEGKKFLHTWKAAPGSK